MKNQRASISRIISIPLLCLTLLIFTAAIKAQTTTFTYQGRFTDSTVAQQPTNGTYSMTFRLYDADTNGNLLGTQTAANVSIVNGIFTVKLDFGASAFNTTGARYLEVQIGSTVLTPRQEVTSTPFATRTNNAGAADSLSTACSGCVSNGNLAVNSVTTSRVANGTVTTPKIFDNAVTSIKILDGEIVNADISATAAIDGGKLTNLNASTLGTGTVPTARLGTGTANSTTFLRGDNTWQAISAPATTNLALNPTLQTGNFTINPANNYTVYQVTQCGLTNVTLPTAAAAGAGRMLFLVKTTPDPCASTGGNLSMHLVLQGGDFLDYIGNTNPAAANYDKGRFTLVSNGVNGWLILNF